MCFGTYFRHELRGKDVRLKNKTKQKLAVRPGAMAHSCNPSSLGGRDQEDQSQPGQIVQETLPRKLNTKKDWLSDSSGKAPA
jgi:hypothetical protein